ncbi:hypothetical protein OIU74_001125 [Salix koriyanagi]|uniref:Uncharacterized protein n=1 Tax=Salix koriyanagi TaxID=2511006 RepID=A0A9Q0X1P7_9ROSI|nr:hypothetical protein OIU74_001125 [Salix koriyanagi]
MTSIIFFSNSWPSIQIELCRCKSSCFTFFFSPLPLFFHSPILKLFCSFFQLHRTDNHISNALKGSSST